MENIIKNTEKTCKNSKIIITNRENINFCGVTKMGSATENSINLELAGENLLIEGTNLHIEKLDIETGVVDIIGTINSLKYTNAKTNKNLFKRIFS